MLSPSRVNAYSSFAAQRRPPSRPPPPPTGAQGAPPLIPALIGLMLSCTPHSTSGIISFLPVPHRL